MLAILLRTRHCCSLRSLRQLGPDAVSVVRAHLLHGGLSPLIQVIPAENDRGVEGQRYDRESPGPLFFLKRSRIRKLCGTAAAMLFAREIRQAAFTAFDRVHLGLL